MHFLSPDVYYPPPGFGHLHLYNPSPQALDTMLVSPYHANILDNTALIGMVNIKRIGHVRHCPWQLLSFPFPFFHLVKDSAKFMLLMKKGHGRALKILLLGLWFTIQHLQE